MPLLGLGLLLALPPTCFRAATAAAASKRKKRKPPHSLDAFAPFYMTCMHTQKSEIRAKGTHISMPLRR